MNVVYSVPFGPFFVSRALLVNITLYELLGDTQSIRASKCECFLFFPSTLVACVLIKFRYFYWDW